MVFAGSYTPGDKAAYTTAWLRLLQEELQSIVVIFAVCHRGLYVLNNTFCYSFVNKLVE